MKKLIKLSIILVIGFLIFSNIFPLLASEGRGYYNTTFKYIVCHNHKQCLHEIGHAVDASMGWVSKTPAYQHEVGAFIEFNESIPIGVRAPFLGKVSAFPGIILPLKPINNPTTLSFWLGGWGGTTELYADMLVWSDGDWKKMPSGFLKFYNWEMVSSLVKKYER